MAGTVKRLPFHEAIIEVVRDANTDGLICLVDLLKMTKIPKGHSEIFVAFQKRLSHSPSILDKLRANLLEQKQEAEAETAEKAEKKDVEGSSVEDAIASLP